ncbi:MAG TPA: polysaccharide biosynthesis/export family protein [Candidatus Polarisedimenticolia bacterium]|nr:polysaccharide biosynthesis/export family protein [Candidatus Polarisedimenticolia bacterium]
MTPTCRTRVAGALLRTIPALVCALLASAPVSAGSLRGVQVEPDGRLLRIDLASEGPILEYTLSRQGPPEKRDLVVLLPGFTSERMGSIDAGEYLLPIEISREAGEGAAGLRVVLGNVGDSLVKVSQDAAGLHLVIIPPQKRSDAADAYRIGVNDMLQIDVFGHEDLNKTLKVAPSGNVNFPLIGMVHAQGRTVDEVAGEIKERLARDYVQDPHVTVSVWEYLSQWINIVGEVSQPGRYFMTGPMTLIDAVSQAGGLTERAGGEILVTRRAEEFDPASAGEVFRVDVRQLFSSEGADLNLRLRSGDVVNVAGRAGAEKSSG